MVNVTTERIDDVLSADVEGRIDGSNVVQFEEAVRTAIEDSDRAVIMDFEKLVYISSAGLRAILLTAKSLQNRDAKLLLCSLSDRIREVFEISGFDKILPIHPSKAEALDSLNR
ncbi:MAG: STAS domain-containing protein [Rhodospirillaceae bacterium]|nr:STAS domain-containing protein [Rhodospirillaceae bacterium]MDE0253423.1 STAS domain-containing protein [Rhodospirillaceae bacterium]MDE0619452.1 STAS domain-containing protein [Rhodospirillaceae bacterium]MXY39663.1 STAS domain-containing protein [Rhodospirillaceae bacterium]MYH37505.1 STAS domain-containing protein [Rhodospirillaceae bacterium]